MKRQLLPPTTNMSVPKGMWVEALLLLSLGILVAVLVVVKK